MDLSQSLEVWFWARWRESWPRSHDQAVAEVYLMVSKLSWRAEQKGSLPSGTRVHYSSINDTLFPTTTTTAWALRNAPDTVLSV